MPELTPEQKQKLDTNIRGMLDGGATQEDVMQYADDFKVKFDPTYKKKALSATASVSNGSESYSSGSNDGGWRKNNKYATGEFEIPNNNPASSTSTNLSRTNEIAEKHRTAPSEEEFKKENEGFRQQALTNTATRRLKAKNKPIDDKSITEEKAAVEKDVADGKLVKSTDGNHNLIFARQPGAGETFIKNLTQATNSMSDAATIAYTKATGTPEELAFLYEMIGHRKKVESEKEFTLTDALSPVPGTANFKDSFAPITDLPTAAPSSTNVLGVSIPTGDIAGFAGGIAPDMALAAGTGGLGTAARTAVIGAKMYTSSYGNKAYELYEQGKQEAMKQGIDEKQASVLAAQAATQNATIAAIPDAALNTLFFSGKLHSPAANNFISVMKGTVKDAVRTGALGMGASALTSGIEGVEGYNTDEWVDKMLKSGGDFAKMDMLFHVLPILSTLPKAAQSAVKEFAVDPVVNPFVEHYLKTVPEDIANQVRLDLQDYKSATDPIRGIVAEEKMASLGGRMQKRQNRLNGIKIIQGDIMELEMKKRNLPEALHEDIDNAIKEKEGQIASLNDEVGGIDKEIETIKNSKGTGLEKEVDEATGEPIISKPNTKLSQPIEGLDEQGVPLNAEPAAQPVPTEKKLGDVVGSGVVDDAEYNDFIDKGKVSDERLNDIANKVKNQEPLSDREKEIFADKTSEINKIIASNPTGKGVEPVIEVQKLTVVPKPIEIKVNDENTQTVTNGTEHQQAEENIQPEIGTDTKGSTTETGEGGQNKVGVHHAALTELADEIGLPKPERAEYLTPEEHAERGRKLMEAGAKLDEIDNKNNDLHDRISIGRAFLEKMYRDLNDLRKTKGVESDEYKAKKNEIETLAGKIKALGSAAGQAMTSLQGERDIDTDNFEVVKRNLEETQNNPASPAQEKAIKELTEKNEELKKRADEAEAKLIEETEKAFNEGVEEGKKQGGKHTDKAKKAANAFRKLKSKPFTFKDDKGNEVNVSTQGITWNDAVELGAKVIEKTGEIADGIKEVIDKIKDADWYNAFSDKEKERFEKELAKHYEKEQAIERPDSFSESADGSLVFDIAQKEIKTAISTGKGVVDAVNKGIAQIRNSDWYKKLSDDKKEKAESEFYDFNNEQTGLTALQVMFENKPQDDLKFTPEEGRAIWDYAKKVYLDSGTSFRDAIRNVSNDTGLSYTQVAEAITTNKTKEVSNEMWKAQSDLKKARKATQSWVEQQKKGSIERGWKTVTGVVRGESVFGHGAIFVGTHAAPTLFDPKLSRSTQRAFLNGWKFAYGSTRNYEIAMEEFTHRKNYLLAQRAGLKNNPERINVEEYQRSQDFLRKIGMNKIATAGERGFNAIKVLRQDIFDYEYSKLSEEEKNDKEAVINIAKIANNATGATNLKVPEVINEVTFAGGMEASRWGRLITNPLKATATALEVIKGEVTGKRTATPSEKVFAKTWAKRAGRQVAMYAAGLIANAAIQKIVSPKNAVNLTNPNDPDFLKFKFGNITVDPTSGMRGAAAFLYGIGKIPFESKKELNGDSRKNALGKSVIGYGRGKLSPAYGIVADFAFHTDFNENTMPYSNEKPKTGKHKLTWGEYAWQKAPLPIAEAANVYYKAATENDNKGTALMVLKGILTGALSGSTGFRVSEDTQTKEEKQKDKDEMDSKDPVFKKFIDKGLSLPNTSHESEIITDEKAATKKKLSDYPKEVQDKYDELHKQNLKKELSSIKGIVYVKTYKDADNNDKVEVYSKPPAGKYKRKIMSDLSNVELAQVLSEAQKKATKETKEKIFNKK